MASLTDVVGGMGCLMSFFLSSWKIHLSTPGEDSHQLVFFVEWQRTSQYQSPAVGTHQPRPSASSMILESPKKDSTTGTDWNKLYSQKEEAFQICICSMSQCPMARGSLSIAHKELRMAPCLLCCRWRLHFLPMESGWGTDIPVELARCHMMHLLKEYKEVHCIPRTWKSFF